MTNPQTAMTSIEIHPVWNIFEQMPYTFWSCSKMFTLTSTRLPNIYWLAPMEEYVFWASGGLWKFLMAAAIGCSVPLITANVSAICIRENVLIDRCKSWHVWNSSRSQRKHLRRRSECITHLLKNIPDGMDFYRSHMSLLIRDIRLISHSYFKMMQR